VARCHPSGNPVAIGVAACYPIHRIILLDHTITLGMRADLAVSMASSKNSGGTFQNAALARHASQLLTEARLRVFAHSKVPPNDGGIALGQLATLPKVLRR
jgi:hydrogenase maturation factor HypF (carbamoyltransferase family)